MSKLVKVEGRVISVPDDATPDEIDSIFKSQPSQNATAPAEPKWYQSAWDRLKTGLDTQKEGAIGTVKGIGNTVNGVSSLLNKVPVVGEYLAPKEGVNAMNIATTPTNTAQKLGYYGEQAAEFLIPGGVAEKVGTKAAVVGPRVAKLAKLGTDVVTSGALNSLQGGGFDEGAGATLIGHGMGAVAKKIAPKIAESALGIRWRDRVGGKKIGEAILDKTSGVRPETIERQAQDVLTTLEGQMQNLEQQAANRGVTTSLQPAIQYVDDAISKAQARNSPNAIRYLQQLREQLTSVYGPQGNVVGQLPVDVSPAKARAIKQGVGEQVKSWVKENPKLAEQTKMGTYGAINSTFHPSVPGSQELDRQMSELIPVVNRAEDVSNHAGVTQNVFDRLKAHTGALAGMAAGGAYGYQTEGVPGAVKYAAIGLVAPEVLTSPTVQMSIARAMRSPFVENKIIPIGKGLAVQMVRNEKGEKSVQILQSQQ